MTFYKNKRTSIKSILSLLMINLVLLTSCSQTDIIADQEETSTEEPPAATSRHQTEHPYGGWYCPDNILGFPAVNVQDLDTIPVVKDRLPTKEETRNGISLMYIDTTEIQDAKPLDIPLPKLARYYNTFTKKNELVVIIQALVVGQDSVVGFRYLNGGNGSAWLDEVNLLSNDEIDKLGSTPFVIIDAEVKVARETIWEVITNPKYNKVLGTMLEGDAFFESDWSNDSAVHLKTEAGEIIRTGKITSSWANMYLQVDYNLDGHHYVEKILLLDGKDKNSTSFHLITGPFQEDYVAKKLAWENWFQKVKSMSGGFAVLDRIVPN
jgi:hypothetical protein